MKLVLPSWQYDLALRDLDAQGLPPTREALEEWATAFFGFQVTVEVIWNP